MKLLLTFLLCLPALAGPGFFMNQQGVVGAVGPRFDPATIGSLRMWLVADDIAGDDGAAVSTWPDSSGVGSNASQGTVSSRPTLRRGYINGRAAVSADGIDDNMGFAANPLAAATAGTMVFVYRQNSDPPAVGGGPISSFGSDAANPGDHWPWTDGNIYDGTFSTARRMLGNPAASLASWSIVVVVSKSAEYSAWINGTLLYTTGSNTFGAGGTPMLLRSRDTLPNYYYFSGQLALVGCFSKGVSTAERKSIEAGLSAMYGISVAP